MTWQLKKSCRDTSDIAFKSNLSVKFNFQHIIHIHKRSSVKCVNVIGMKYYTLYIRSYFDVPNFCTARWLHGWVKLKRTMCAGNGWRRISLRGVILRYSTKYKTKLTMPITKRQKTRYSTNCILQSEFILSITFLVELE